jgi:hypothetical protein
MKVDVTGAFTAEGVTPFEVLEKWRCGGKRRSWYWYSPEGRKRTHALWMEVVTVKGYRETLIDLCDKDPCKLLARAMRRWASVERNAKRASVARCRKP